jgi:hypothetical protein
MCMPKPPKPQDIPERQALKLPDGGASAPRVEDDVRRRRAMMASVFKGVLGQGSGPATTTVLGG